MYGEDPEGGGLTMGHPGYAIVPAYELEGVANEQHLFGGAVSGIIIVSLDLLKPVPVGCFPFAAFAVQGAAGASARNIDIVGEIGQVMLQADFELVVLQFQSMFTTVLRE